MNFIKWIGLFALMGVLVGCGTAKNQASGNMTPDQLVDGATVVLTATKEKIFMDTTVWDVRETKFSTTSGKKITAEDIQPGDLVRYVNVGAVAESYPMQGALKEVVLFDDEFSMKVSDALASFFENQQEGDLLVFQLVSINNEQVTAEMKRWDFEDDRTFIVVINLESHKFEISEKSGAQD